MPVPQYLLTSADTSLASLGPLTVGAPADTYVFLNRSTIGPGTTATSSTSGHSTQNPSGNVGAGGGSTAEKANSRSGSPEYNYGLTGAQAGPANMMIWNGAGAYRKMNWTPSRPDRPVGGAIASGGGEGVQQREDNAVWTHVMSWNFQHSPGEPGVWRGRRRPRTRDCLWMVNRSTIGKLATACYAEKMVVVGRVDFP